MITGFLHGATISLGIATVILSLYAAYRFHVVRDILTGHSDRLSRALCLQLLGEFVIGFLTLIFTLAAYTGHLATMSEIGKDLMRLIMFSATSVTTWRLVRTINGHHER